MDRLDLVRTSDRHQLLVDHEGRYSIKLISRENPRNFATISKVYVVSSGEIIGTSDITPNIYEYVISNNIHKGLTESLLIPSSIVSTDSIQGLPQSSEHQELIHKYTFQENSYTSTGDKLLYHWPLFSKLRDTGYGSIIRATLTLHQKCSSKCPYCSTINRSASDSISLEEAKEFVSRLYYDQAAYNQSKFPTYNSLYKNITGSDIRLRGLILSGGGQPNLWPFFAEFVDWLSNLDIDLGLITNGFPKNVDQAVYKSFSWVRLSITPPEASPFYPDGEFSHQFIPDSITTSETIKKGLSYVWGPWCKPGDLRSLDDKCISMGFDYVRILTDCTLERTSQLEAHRQLSISLLNEGLIDSIGNPTSKVFHQLKFHAESTEADLIWPSGQCFLQTYNVFWDTSGHDERGESYCYPCDSITVLTSMNQDGNITDSSRKFDSTIWGTVTNKNIHKLYREPVTSFFDPRQVCNGCLFKKNNIRVNTMTSMSDSALSAMLIDAQSRLTPEHINFP